MMRSRPTTSADGSAPPAQTSSPPFGSGRRGLESARPLARLLAQARYRVTSDALNWAWEHVRSAGAIGPSTSRGRRFGTFGAGSIVGFPTASLYGEAQIHIGEGTLVCAWVTLAAGYGPGQTTVPPRALVIGDRCVIGARSGIVAHESIEIGDDVWFGPDVYVTDANHGFEDPDVPIGRQLGAHEPVSIGAGSWLGKGVVVLPGSRIGRHVVVAAGSIVSGEFPDHSVIAGVPARVLRLRRPDGEWVRPSHDDALAGERTSVHAGTTP